MMAKRRSSVIMYVRVSLRILLGSCILIFTRLMLAKSQNTKMLKKVEVNNDIYICIFAINVRHLDSISQQFYWPQSTKYQQ